MKNNICIIIALSIVLLFTISVSADNNTIYISASDFENHIGSWIIPDIVKDNAGGVMPYLKSPKPAEPKSAMVSLETDADMEMHLYAYTRDYASSQGSRRFHISVNGTTLDKKFGTHGVDGWSWEYGGTVLLKKGISTIEIIDSSRNYGRIMAIALCSEKSFNGPVTKDEFVNAFETNHARICDTVIIPQPDDKVDSEEEKKPSYIPENIPVVTKRPDDEIAVKLNDKYLVFQDDSKPFIENGRTLVPFRAIFEALGCSVDWNDSMKTAIGIRDNIDISLPVKNNLAKVSGENIYLDQPAIISNSRVMVPIRFVAESLGAFVTWDSATKTVEIYAEIPKTTDTPSYLILPESFTDYGTWKLTTSGSGSFETGMLTGGSQNKPENTVSAKAYFNISEPGEYRVWVHSRDYATNQPGTRFFNVAINSKQLSETFGTHGKEGFYWSDGGTIELSVGETLLELIDSSDFFGRCDAVIITKNIEKSEPYSDLEKLKRVSKIVKKKTLENSVEIPSYANETGKIISTHSIENEFIKVDFYTVETSNGNIVQNSITTKANGIITKERTEDFAVLLLSADRAELENSIMNRQIFNTAYTDFYGNAQQYYGANIYRAANVNYLIPQIVSVENNVACLEYSNELVDTKIFWSLENTGSKIEVIAKPKESGYYSLGVFEGSELSAVNIENPESIVSDPGIVTFDNQGIYKNGGMIKGVKTYSDTGICMRGPTGNFRATAFSPVLGSENSFKNVGDSISFKCEIISLAE